MMNGQTYLSKIQNWNEAHKIVNQWKSQGLRIVFTNGCFDILHPGHVDYLSKARSLGDKLVIGLNSDASVSKLKGPHRPIQNEEARARVMAALESTDLIVVFNQETPLELITLLLPDLLVKGGDYQVNNIVGYEVVKQNGGDVLTIDFLPGYSTSSIEEKIKKA